MASIRPQRALRLRDIWPMGAVSTRSHECIRPSVRYSQILLNQPTRFETITADSSTQDPMMLSEMQPAPSRFLALPAEIRRMIYRRLLVQPCPLFIWGLPGRLVGPVWLALLYTSRQISKEARLVLYGENQFIVPDVEVEEYLLEVFLNGIGPVNAGLLSHLRINFPAPEWEYGKWKQPSQANLRNLELLRTVCTNLRTLEGVYDSDFGGLIKMPDSIPFFREALFEINEQFRHNRSLREISVKIRRGSGSSAYAKAIEIMQKLGWAVVFGWPGSIDSFF